MLDDRNWGQVLSTTIGFRIGRVTDSADDLAALTALGDLTRRRVYLHVASSAEPQSRDQVAQLLELPRSTAAFHLERLADEGMLETTQVRRSGKTGPGAGRPAKLYRRSSRQFSLTVPPRDYELAARLLAAAMEASSENGGSADDELDTQARRAGKELRQHGEPGTVVDTLTRHGFEPRTEDDHIVLGNCPFKSLATEFPKTVCRMNLHLVRGMLEANDALSWSASLDPAPDICCVRLRRSA